MEAEQEDWNRQRGGMWERWETEKDIAHYCETQHDNTSSSKSTQATLTLCLWGEGQGEFGKELIVFKFPLFRLGPETLLREVLRSDLRERCVQRKRETEGDTMKKRDILYPLDNHIIKLTQFSQNGHLCTWQTMRWADKEVGRTKETAIKGRGRVMIVEGVEKGEGRKAERRKKEEETGSYLL